MLTEIACDSLDARLSRLLPDRFYRPRRECELFIIIRHSRDASFGRVACHGDAGDEHSVCFQGLSRFVEAAEGDGVSTGERQGLCGGGMVWRVVREGLCDAAAVRFAPVVVGVPK